MRGRAGVVTIAAVSAALGACFVFAAPAPAPARALGCYEVIADGWSERAAYVTGFKSLPSMIALDPDYDHGGFRVTLPDSWRAQARGSDLNSASWGNYASDWLRLQDSIVATSSGRPHQQADSIHVTWYGSVGYLTAFLEPTADGYAGLGQLYPRQIAAGAPRVNVQLRRDQCPKTI